MIDSEALARLSLARLRLPVPSAKLVAMRSFASGLDEPEIQTEYWGVFRQWLSQLELESEVVEALTIPVMARSSQVVSIHQLRAAISKPSILSDFLLQEISGEPSLVRSWERAHSGDPTPCFDERNVLKEITDGRVSRIFESRLRSLQRQSGKPLLKHWAFEFQRLTDTYASLGDGSWEYFIRGVDRRHSTGQFVTRRSHAIRSAYLRTLAYAVNVLNMPNDLALEEAGYASPFDPTFLHMGPANPPHWATHLHSASPTAIEDCIQIVAESEANLRNEISCGFLLHLNAPLKRTGKYQSEVEVVTCLILGSAEPEEAFEICDHLAGNLVLPRTSEGTIRVVKRSADDAIPSKAGGKVLPAIWPSVSRAFGYLHLDLGGRIPYVPANYWLADPLVAQPLPGGMVLRARGSELGRVRYWNDEWSPTHVRGMGPNCAVATYFDADALKEISSVAGMSIVRFIRATILTRDSDYGDWVPSEICTRWD